MPKLSMDCKKLMISEIVNRLDKADTLIVTNYKGLTAQDLNELRRELRNVSGDYVVVKDSIVKKALAESKNNKISEFIKGEVGIVVNRKSDPAVVSKVLIRFAKDHESLKISGGLMSGNMLSKEDVKVLAALPSREVLLGNLANVLNAPIQGLAGALNAIICKLAYALNAVKEKKGQGVAKEEAQTTDQGPQAEKTEEPKIEDVKPQTENKEEGNG